MSDEDLLNLKTQADKLKALLDKPLKGNKAWELSVRITVRTIADYEDF